MEIHISSLSLSPSLWRAFVSLAGIPNDSIFYMDFDSFMAINRNRFPWSALVELILNATAVSIVVHFW